MRDDRTTRRSFLAAVGGASLFGLSGVAAADGETANQPRPLGTGGPGNDQNLPVFADGKSIHRYERDGDGYTYQHTFVSGDLRERYGDAELRFEPERVPERLVSDDVRTDGTTTITTRDRLVVGTADEHATAEQHIHQQRRESDVSAQTHLTDDLPLYHYKNEADAQDKQSRKAPINVGWEDADSAQWVKEFLEGDCNWTQYDWLPEQPRYINDGGTVKSTDEHVMDRIYVTEQWHVRLYEVSDDTYTVVGQAHKDPLNHNQLITIDDWNFDKAKREIVSDWQDNSSRYVYWADLANGSGFDSHNGSAGLLRP